VLYSTFDGDHHQPCPRVIRRRCLPWGSLPTWWASPAERERGRADCELVSVVEEKKIETNSRDAGADPRKERCIRHPEQLGFRVEGLGFRV